jgi:carboxypeptidase family protein
MNRLNLMLIAVVVCCASSVAAQPAVRPTDPARSVTLSLTEYNRLTDLAGKTPPGPPVPPVGAVLSSADLRVRVEGTTTRGVFTLAGEVLRSGVSRVNLLSGATVLEASAGGRPLPLLVDGRVHAAFVTGPGPFTVDLEWGAPLAFRPGRASFILPVPPAGAARATIDLPGDQADVHLSAGWITRRSTANGRTIIEATLDPGSATEVWWSMRDSAPIASAREVRTVADVMTLVTLGDSDVRMVALVDLTVVQGEPRTVEVRLPSGYEVTRISGNTLETSESRDDAIVLTLADPAARRHQFLFTLERPHADGSFTLDTGLIAVTDVQRERGEVAIEGVGTLDLAAEERPGMHRIDVRELNRTLQSLARMPLLASFRYQRSATAPPGLTLAVTRFADAGVLAAAVDRAMVTTLVTSEGRALTEMSLRVRNRAQPFLKVTLPPGASMVSVEVAGETAKPVQGSDGTRVPLLRAGFRPKGPYDVSFVYLHAGAPFARKGEMQMALPRMDIPVGIVEWEVFAPDTYSLRHAGGNVISQATLERALLRDVEKQEPADRVGGGAGTGAGTGIGPGTGGGTGGGAYRPGRGVNTTIVARPDPSEQPGQISGRVIDPGGSVLSGVTVSVTSGGARLTATTGGDGTFVIAGVPPGPVSLTADLIGFATQTTRFVVGTDAWRADVTMPVTGAEETVTVTAQAPVVDEGRPQAPPQNVINLQRRAAGVLPIRVDVPRAGTSHRFSRPLVVDEETTVAFRYKRR